MKSYMTESLFSALTIAKLLLNARGVEVLDFSLTATKTGFRKPALISCCNSLV